ncbi:signal peptide peptidase-like 2A isoform X1 [Lates japonicus]|uniref:Signal peptide peptidase-like 2A isoform X1 n=1 Tax=Lates japonicus TaxID=270547 RepID=A0AAD3MNT6_LATJO|nr:signal peptide peptidase-like 2A isoform X1 [Lates japonicus]
MERAVKVVLLSVVFMVSKINCQEAILHISDGSIEREYCIVHNHSWTPLSQTLDAAVNYPLVNMTSTVLCNGSGISPEEVKGKALVVMRGDCDFSQKAVVAQSLGAATLLIASNTLLITPSANDSEYAKVNISLALMRYRDFLEAQQTFSKNMMVKLYAPPHLKIDPSIAVILLIAIVTVALGGYWSGACERDRLNSGTAGGRRRGRTQSRQWRTFPVLSSQSGYLCCHDVWDAGPHVLLLQCPRLHHYCYILPGICHCTVQLS